MKLAILTDVHANLPALEAALDAIDREGYDELIHTGDVVGTGPHPAECLDVLLNARNVRFLMGNHDAWFAHGLSAEEFSRMTANERAHQDWTHQQIDPRLRSVVAQWPYVVERVIAEVSVTFLHYPLADGHRTFAPLLKNPGVADLDRLFGTGESRLVFYGHYHLFSDVQGRTRYITPGSVGCHDRAVARYAVVEFRAGRYEIAYRNAPYDDASLFQDFEKRKVPEREFIYRAFFGGRYHGRSSAKLAR